MFDNSGIPNDLPENQDSLTSKKIPLETSEKKKEDSFMWDEEASDALAWLYEDG